jgi:superfamily I DNA/RNA helicase
VSKKALEDGVITKEQRRENFAKRLSMRKLVSISKSTLVDPMDGNAVLAIIDRYNVDIDDEYVAEIVEKLPEIIALCMREVSVIDFDDMVWLPIVLDISLIKFDVLMVDEAQDLNACQIEFVLHSIKGNGRIIAVGDRNQSLYGFRGADTDAIPNLIAALNATTLPLSITFRCPTSHVELAKRIVPQIEARENAPEGVIVQTDYIDLASMLETGDMVVCRTNGPLVKPAFECIRAGKKAVIRGKDIGNDLIALIKRFETDDLASFDISLMEYFEREYNKYLNKGKEMSAMMLEDKVLTLRMIMEEVSTVNELMSKIMMLFGDNNVGIIFSSVHRAKGLEANRVFILRPDLMPHPKAKKDWERVQEMNCMYVAQTRSKDSLFIVNGGKDNV